MNSSSFIVHRSSFIVCLLTLLVPLARAREFTVKLTPTEIKKISYVQTLVAPGATCAAVGEAVNKVAIGQKIDKEAQVSLYFLDDAGKPFGIPVVVKLPRPATLAGRETYPLSLAFHPSLPLLYVWQDVEALKGDPVPPADPAWKDFDHLLVYAVNKAAPELLLSLCRGQRFHTGCAAGSVHADAAGGKLYVPNMRFGPKNPPDSAGVGWFSLDGDGLPVAGDEEPKNGAPVLTPEKAVTVRLARVAALKAAVAADKPVGAFRHTPANTYGFGGCPAGMGFIPYSRDVFIAGGLYGPVTWNAGDRRARAQVFLMPINFVCYYRTRIAVHPTQPAVFASVVGYSYAHRVEHAEGYLTLAPQIVLLENATLKTAPIVMGRRNLVAFGGPKALYLAPIDAAGKFEEKAGLVAPIEADDVEGIAWSEKFDRLYVAVEKPK
jgi:hypothetical protein